MSFFKTGIITALSLVLFLFLAKTSLADTLVKSGEIKFHSDFEEQIFTKNFNTSKKNYLALYLAGDPGINDDKYQEIQAGFLEIVEKYKTKKYQKLNDQKRVRKIAEDVYDALLDKYVQDKSFSSIFENGEYQCVTSTMLYSLIFKELAIPFEIKLLPRHTYLIAYPDDHYILVETTDPFDGTTAFDDQFKSDYVHFLREHKLISREEFEEVQVEELFHQYYMKPETINQLQLAGAQYYNLSLHALAGRDFLEGYHLMEKAYILQPSTKNSFMLLFALSNAINEISVNDPIHAEYLGKLMRFNNRGVSHDQLFGLFSNLTNRQLLFDGNTALYEESFNNIISEVCDSALYADISFLYHFERGRVLYLNSDYDAAEQFIGEAFLLKPKSADVKAMFYGIMLAKMEEIKQGEGAYTLTKFQDYFSTISDYKKRFIHLNEMKGFRQAWLFFCLGLMDQFYQFNDAENGEKYRAIFEADYPQPISDFGGINKGISGAYTTAASYYMQNKNLSKSLEITNKGLEYTPDNSSLLQIKDQAHQ